MDEGHAPRPVVLQFPGQGAHQHGMAVGLYRGSREFRERVDEVFAVWGAWGEELRRDWLAEWPDVELDDVRRSQPLLFAVNWALGRMIMDWGVTPAGLLGHSVGEVVAATLAGVLDLTDAATVLADRVAMMTGAPAGGMLAVAASASAVEPYLGDGVALAAVNAPRQVMLAGPDGPLKAARAALAAGGFSCRPVGSRVPFHSPVVAEAAQRSRPVLGRVALRPPALRLFSCHTSGPVRACQATDAGFWASQPADTVWFWPALDALLRERAVVLVEAGPSQVLTGIARRHPTVASGQSTVVGMLPARSTGAIDADVAAVEAVHSLLRREGWLPHRRPAEQLKGTES